MHHHLRKFYLNYRSKLTKANIKKQQLLFLKCCLKNKIIPRTLISHQLKTEKQDPFPSLYFQLLMEKIKQVTSEIKFAFKKCNICLKLFQVDWFDRFPDEVIQFSNYINIAHQYKEQIIYQKAVNLKTKFNKIYENSPWVKGSNSCNIVNLSTYILKRDEEILLGYG